MLRVTIEQLHAVTRTLPESPRYPSGLSFPGTHNCRTEIVHGSTPSKTRCMCARNSAEQRGTCQKRLETSLMLMMIHDPLGTPSQRLNPPDRVVHLFPYLGSGE
jgi:hypothetical protein